MGVAGSCPTFDDAVERLQAFMTSQGWPTSIRWALAEDVTRLPRPAVTVVLRPPEEAEAEAVRRYDEARQKGLGVALDAVCTVGRRACVVVRAPADKEEAERSMYPEDGGLKLSLALPRLERAGLLTRLWWGCFRARSSSERSRFRCR